MVCNESGEGCVSTADRPTQLVGITMMCAYTCKGAECGCYINPVMYRDPQEYNHINLCVYIGEEFMH